MLRLKLFGAPALERDGAPVVGRAAQRHRLALLALLALAILGPPGQPAAIPEPARRRGVPYVETPTDLSRFVEVIRQAHESRWWQATSDRRRAPLRDPATERDADGTLVYLDRHGARWHVYDRRGADRRRDRRLFVNDQGETFSVPLIGDDAGSLSAPELERQLARATRV